MVRVFKIKKPTLAFQKELRYVLVKEYKTTWWVREINSEFIYKGVNKSSLVEL